MLGGTISLRNIPGWIARWRLPRYWFDKGKNFFSQTPAGTSTTAHQVLRGKKEGIFPLLGINIFSSPDEHVRPPAGYAVKNIFSPLRPLRIAWYGNHPSLSMSRAVSEAFIVIPHHHHGEHKSSPTVSQSGNLPRF